MEAFSDSPTFHTDECIVFAIAFFLCSVAAFAFCLVCRGRVSYSAGWVDLLKFYWGASNKLKTSESEKMENPSPRNVLPDRCKSSKGKSRSREKLDISSSGPSSQQSPSPSQSKVQSSTFKPPENWANAPEFVPRWLAAPSSSSGEAKRSYAAVVGQSQSTSESSSESYPIVGDFASNGWGEWCPYHLVGECRFGDQCLLLHGLKCDYCGEYCLHPYDITQRDQHIKECVAEHEKDMEISFAVARSVDKTCGICYEKIMSKEPPSEQRFGILPSCNHCFCLSCIRRWRQAKNFENKIIRACPECRVTSDFVCPSRYWVDNKEEKDKLIGCYKVNLRQKDCRYYRNGEGQCPFGNKCFYRHALPDGREVDVGPPRRLMGENGQVPRGGQDSTLWDFVEDWEIRWMNIEDIMEMMDPDNDLEDILDDTFDYWHETVG